MGKWRYAHTSICIYVHTYVYVYIHTSFAVICNHFLQQTLFICKTMQTVSVLKCDVEFLSTVLDLDRPNYEYNDTILPTWTQRMWIKCTTCLRCGAQWCELPAQINKLFIDGSCDKSGWGKYLHKSK